MFAVGLERCRLRVVLQIHGELVDTEFAQDTQSAQVLGRRTQQTETIDDLIRHELGVRVPGPTVFVVVVTATRIDVLRQRGRHAAAVAAVARDDIRHVVADHRPEPSALIPRMRQSLGTAVGDVGRCRNTEGDRGGIATYICASNDDTVQVLDLATRKIVDTLPSGEDPEQFALHPNNKHLYIANEDDAIVTVVDVDSKEVLAQIDVGIEPEGMAVSPNGKWAVNTSETTSMLHWINTETFEIEKNIVVGQRPRHVEFSKDSKTAWASAEIGGTVHIIDVENLEQIHEMSFKVPGVNQDRVQPVGIELTSDGKYAFVALGPSNHVAVVDAKTYEVLDYLLVGARVWQLDLDKDETHLYTTNGVSGDVSVINLEDMKVIKSIKVGRYPWGVVIDPTS